MCAYLGDFRVLETLLRGNGLPVNVCLVLGVLDDAKEQHSLGGGRLLLGLRHDVQGGFKPLTGEDVRKLAWR